MPTIVKGQPPSAEIRQKLAQEGRPVLVAFSLGKDAIAAELALQDAGVETHLAYMYLVPPNENGQLMSFIEDTIAYFGLNDKKCGIFFGFSLLWCGKVGVEVALG